ncbi:Pyridoxal phosphate-dependent transferase, partial [mine drainage metagenome]
MLDHPEVEAALRGVPHDIARDAMREELAELRRRALGEGELLEQDLTEQAILGGVLSRLGWYLHAGPTEVINATGVVLHTNLGRAPMARSAVEAAARAAAGYSDLEYDRRTGMRGSRQSHLEEL